MAQASTKEIYLRVVTRVFIVRQITVSLTNEDSLAAGLDVGAAPELKLLEMSTRDPGAAEDSTAAYAKTLEALSNEGKIVPEGAAPGGAFRFAQASSRAVTMNETFKRPLVIGYLGFDVRVYKDGFLSVPIPSFATITGKATATAYTELSKDTRAKFAAMKEMSSADLDSLPDAKLDAAWQAAVEVGLLGADVRLPRGNFKDTPEGKRAFLKAISQPDDRPGRMEQIEEFRAKLAGL
jgi:hypothetical protein